MCVHHGIIVVIKNEDMKNLQQCDEANARTEAQELRSTVLSTGRFQK